MLQPAPSAILRRLDLGDHAARAQAPRRACPAMASISGVISLTSGMSRASGRARRRGIEPVNIGEQHQAIGRHHRGNPGRQPVIVAIADFGRRHRVVLVDDRHRALLQQCRERGARIEIAPALFGVVERHQHLRRNDAARAEGFRPGMRQGDLADRRRRLLFFEPQIAMRKAQRPPAKRDGAR